MPRDMFGDVNGPSIKIGNRKWYTVPVSLFSHAMIVLAFVAAPLLLPGILPMPDSIKAFVMSETPIPPEPPRPKPIKSADEPKPPSNPNAAPTSAPTDIKPEVPRDPASADTIVDVVPGAGEKVFTDLPAPVEVKKVPSGPVQVGGVIRTPRKLTGQQPVYPQIAQQARVQGIVIIEATISEDGHVMNAKLLRSIPLLDQAALDAVRTWTYSPTLLNGIPVAVIMTVTVQFSLQ